MKMLRKSVSILGQEQEYHNPLFWTKVNVLCRLKGPVAVEVFKSFISSECNRIEDHLMNT